MHFIDISVERINRLEGYFCRWFLRMYEIHTSEYMLYERSEMRLKIADADRCAARSGGSMLRGV